MNARQQQLARLLREVKHHVAQKDHVEAVVDTVVGQSSAAEIGLAEVAHLLHFRLDYPILAVVIEVAHDKARRETAVHLDAVITGCLGAFHHFGADIRALDAQVPAREQGEMLEHHHAQTVCFLAGGAGCAPKTKSARMAPRLNQFRQQLRAQQFKRTAIAEEAGLVDSHGVGNGALEQRVLSLLQVLHQLFEVQHALVAQ